MGKQKSENPSDESADIEVKDDNASEHPKISASENETNDSVIDKTVVASQLTPDPSDHVKKSKWSWFRPEVIFPTPLRKKLGRSARPLSLALIAIVLVGGVTLTYWEFSGGKTAKPPLARTFKLNVTSFKLVSTAPSDKATNVNTATDLVLNFNEPVNPNKLINNMFITPNVSGKYSQGNNPNQVVFKPAQPFAQGSKVAVMINGSYESSRGSQLGKAYEYGFTTSIPADGIEFQDQNGLIDNVTSLSSAQKETYTLLVGSDVGSGATVTLYKGDVSDLLSSLVYTTSSEDGTSFSDLAVSTSDLQQISTTANVTDNQSYSVQQPDGLYVAVATNSAGKEVGLVWIDFSNLGLLLRQDDQKVVYDAQTFSNSQDVAANVSFYNLNGSVDLLAKQTINGLTTTDFPYSPSLDLAVATSGGETTVVPINILNSGGDIRVDQDLSTAQQVYGVTDKPTYKVGDNVQYSGFVRLDNDAQYTNPGSGSVNLYVAQYKGGTPLDSFTAPVDANGMFSGSFTPGSSWLTSGDNFDQFQIFASAVDGNSNNDIPVASFSLTAQANSPSNIKVQFSQSSYLPNNTITATITGTNSSGQPLANTNLALHVFAEDYYENDLSANQANFGYSGNELPNSPFSITLNSSGQATYIINPSSLPNDGNSQLVTLQANIPGQSGVGAAGGASTIIHQGDGELTFGTDRQDIPTGSDLISEVYAEHLNGTSMSNASISYQLIDSSNNATLTSGTAQTNSVGMAKIDIPSSSLSSSDGMQLKVSATDENGNAIEAENYYSVESQGDDSQDTSGAGLLDLDVSGSSTNINVGDTVNLNISSPTNIRAMVTYDRGRIYSPAMLNLTSGNNNYSFTVASDLAPSFTLTFNYFLNGVYHSEGVLFNVSESSQAANVNIAPSSQTVSTNSPTTIQLNTTDSNGDPLATKMIVDVVSSNAYGLSSSVSPDIYSVLYASRPIMTNSSSSLSPVGSGGGRCGGGGGDLPSFANATGTTLEWLPELSTNSSGQASFTITPPSGSWTINVYAMSGNSQVGEAQTTITAK